MDSDSERSQKLELGRQRLEKYRQKKHGKKKKASAGGAVGRGGAEDATASSDGHTTSDQSSSAAARMPGDSISVDHGAVGSSGGGGDEFVASESLPDLADPGAAQPAGAIGAGSGDVIAASSSSPGRDVVLGDGQSQQGTTGRSAGIGSSGGMHTSNDVSPIPFDDMYDGLGDQRLHIAAKSSGADRLHLEADDLLARASDILAEHSTDVSSSSAHPAAVRTGAENDGVAQLCQDDAIARLHASNNRQRVLEERLQISEQQLEDAIGQVQTLQEERQAQAADLEDAKRRESESVNRAVQQESEKLTSGFQAERQQLQDTLSQVKEDAATARTSLETKISGKQGDIEELRLSLKSAQTTAAQAEQELHDEVGQLGQALSDAAATHAEQQRTVLSRLDALQEEKNALSSSLKESAAILETERDSLGRDLDAARQESTALASQVQQLKDAAASSDEKELVRHLQSQVHALEGRVLETESERNAIHAERASLEQQLADTRHQASSLAIQHTSDLQAAQADCEALRAHIASSQRAAEDANFSKESTLQHLASANEALESKVAELNQAFTTESHEKAHNQAAMAALQQGKDQLITQLMSVQTANQQLSLAYSEAQERVEQSKTAQNQLQLAMQEKNQMLEEVSASMLAESDDQDERLRLSDELAAAEQELGSLRQRLTASEGASQELQRQFGTQLLTAEREKEQVEEELRLCAERLRRESDAKQAVTDQLRQAEATARDLQDTCSQGVVVIGERDSQIEQLQRDCAELNTSLTSLSQEESVLSDSVNSLRRDLRAANEDRAALEEQLAVEKTSAVASQTSLAESHRTEVERTVEQLNSRHTALVDELVAKQQQELQAQQDQLHSQAESERAELHQQHASEYEHLQEKIGEEEAKCQSELAAADTLRDQVSELQALTDSSRNVLASCVRALGTNGADETAVLEDSAALPAYIQRSVDAANTVRTNLLDVLEAVGLDGDQAELVVEQPKEALAAVSGRLSELEASRQQTVQRMQAEMQRILQQSQAVQANMDEEHRVALLRAAEQQRDTEARLEDEQGVVSILQEQDLSAVQRVRQEGEAALQAAVSNRRRELDDLVAEHADSMSQLTAEQQARIEQLQQEHANTLQEVRASLADAQDQAADHAAELGHLIESHRAAVAGKDALQANIDQLITQHDEEMAELKHEHSDAVLSLRNEVREQSRDLIGSQQQQQEAVVAAACQQLSARHDQAVEAIGQQLTAVLAEKDALERRVQELQDDFSAQLRAHADELEATKDELTAAMSQKELLYQEEIESLQQQLDTQLDSHDATLALDSQRALLQGETEEAMRRLHSQLEVQHEERIAELQEQHSAELQRAAAAFKVERDQLQQSLSELGSAATQETLTRRELEADLHTAGEDATQKDKELLSLQSSVEQLKLNYDREVASVREESTRLLTLQSGARASALKEQYEQALAQLQASLEQKTAKAVQQARSTLASEMQAEITSLKSQHDDRVGELEADHQSAAEAEGSRRELAMVEDICHCVDEIRQHRDSDLLSEWPTLHEKLVAWGAAMEQGHQQHMETAADDFAALVQRLSDPEERLVADDNDPLYAKRLVAWRTSMDADRRQLAALEESVSTLNGQLSGHKQQVEEALERQQSDRMAQLMQTFEDTVKEVEARHQLETQKRDRQEQALRDQHQQALAEERQHLHAEMVASGDEKVVLAQQQLWEQYQGQLRERLTELQEDHQKDVQLLQAKLTRAHADQEAQFHQALSAKQADLDKSTLLCQDYSQSFEKLKADAEAAMRQRLAEQEAKLQQRLTEQEAKLQQGHAQAVHELRQQLLQDSADTLEAAVQHAEEECTGPLQEQLASLARAKVTVEGQLSATRDQLQDAETTLEREMSALATSKATVEETLSRTQQQLQDAQAAHQKFVTSHLATAIGEAEKWQGSCKTALIERDEARARATAVQQICDQRNANIASLEQRLCALQQQLSSLRDGDEGRESRRSSELEEVSNLLCMVEDDKEKLDVANADLTAANQKLLAVLSSLAQSLGKSSDVVTVHRQRLRTLSSAREQPEGEQQQEEQRRLPAPSTPGALPPVSLAPRQRHVVGSAGDSLAGSSVASTATGGRHSYPGSSPLMSSTMNDDLRSTLTSASPAGRTALGSGSTTADSGFSVGVTTVSSSESVGGHVPSPLVPGASQRQQHQHPPHTQQADQSTLLLSFSSLPPSQLNNFTFELGEAGESGVAAALVDAVHKLWSPRKDSATEQHSDAASDELSQDFNDSMFEGPTIDEESEALLCRVAGDLHASLQQLFLEHAHHVTAYQATISRQDGHVQRLARHCADLQALLDAAAQEVEAVSSEREQSVASAEAEHAKKLSALKEDLADVRRQATEVSEDKQALTAECNRLQQEFNDMRSRCGTLQQDEERWTRQLAKEQEQHRANCVVLQEKLVQLAAEKESTGRRLADLDQDMATVNLLRERLVALSAENDGLRQQLDEHLQRVGFGVGDMPAAAFGTGIRSPVDHADGDSESDSLSNVSDLSNESSLRLLASGKVVMDASDQDRQTAAEWVVAVTNVLNEWAAEIQLTYSDRDGDVLDGKDCILPHVEQLRAAMSASQGALSDEHKHLANELRSAQQQLETRTRELEEDAARLTDHLAVSCRKTGELVQLLELKTEELALAEERLAAYSDRSEGNLRAMEEAMTQRQAAGAESLQQEIQLSYQQQLNSTLASVQLQHQDQLQAVKTGHLAIVDQLVQQHALEVQRLSQCLQAARADQSDSGLSDDDDLSALLLRGLEGLESESEQSLPSQSTALGLALQLHTDSQRVLELSECVNQLKFEDSAAARQLLAERDALQTTVNALQQLLLHRTQSGHGDGSALRNDIVEALQGMFAQQRHLLSGHAGQSTADALVQQQKTWDAERALLHSEIQQLQRSLETLRQESQQYAAELQAKLASHDQQSVSLASVGQLQQRLSNALQHTSQLQAALTNEKALATDLRNKLAPQLSELQALRVRNLELSEQLSAAQQSSAQATLQLHTEQQRVAELHRSLDALQAESNRLASGRCTDEASLKAALEEQAQRLEQMRSDCAGREADLQAKVHAQQQEVVRLSRHVDLAVAAERERGEQLLAQEAAGAAEIRRLLEEERRSSLSASRRGDSDRDAARRAGEQLRAAEVQRHELRAELQQEQTAALEANGRVLELEQMVTKLSAALAEHELLATQLRATLEEKALQCLQLESRLSELDRLRHGERDEGHRRAQQQLQSALRTTQEQVEDLTRQLNAEQRAVQELSAKEQINAATFASLQHDKDKLEAQLTSARQQLRTASEALAAKKSAAAATVGDESGCFQCRISVPRLQRQHDDMSRLAERLSQERARVQDELNQVMEKERRLRREHQQLRVTSQVTEQQRATDQASWQKERASLLNQLSTAQPSGHDSDLPSRYARAERFRRELSFQKQYLMTLLGGFADCEEAVLRQVNGHGPMSRQQKQSTGSSVKINRFVVCARAIIAVSRMKRFTVSPPIPRPLPAESFRRSRHLLPKETQKSAMKPAKSPGTSHRQPSAMKKSAGATGAVDSASRGYSAPIAPFKPSSRPAAALDNVSEAESSQSEAAYQSHLERLHRLQDRLNSVSLPTTGPATGRRHRNT